MKKIRTTIISLAWLMLPVLLQSCGSDTDAPEYLAPRVSLEPASDITRESAIVRGTVEAQGGNVTELTMRFGLTEAVEQVAADCRHEGNRVEARLTGLTPGTKYYYRLDAGNGYDLVSSATLSFVTEAPGMPLLTDVELINNTPKSVLLQFRIIDDGGTPPTEIGVYCRDADGNRRKVSVADAHRFRTGDVVACRVGALVSGCVYYLSAYAVNECGESVGEPLEYTCANSIKVNAAGILGELIPEDERYEFGSITIEGVVNGTDLRLLRAMAGKNVDGSDTPGRLREINLTAASIVDGGLSYDAGNYSRANIVSHGLFAGLPYLESIQLPTTAVEIEEDAFSDCPLLQQVVIDADVAKIGVSTNCPSLQHLVVAAGNRWFSTVDGVLYDASRSKLLWCPQGMNSAPAIPASVTVIGDYAFAYYSAATIQLPAALKEVGDYAFRMSALVSLTLPDGVANIGVAAFGNCHRLVELRLGEDTSYIKDYMLTGCESLQDLYVPCSPFAPMCADAVWGGFDNGLQRCTLHVPKGMVKTYRNNPSWSKFETITDK